MQCAIAALVVSGLSLSAIASGQESGKQVRLVKPGLIQRSTVVVKPAPKPAAKSRTVTMPAETPEQRRQRDIRTCERQDAKFYLKIKGIKLRAVGSDVDEIFGRVYIMSGSTRAERFQSSHWGTNWQRNDLWSSKGKSINIGKYPQTFFSTITVPIDRSNQSFYHNLDVHVDLTDEDGSQGGRDDEFFYLPGNNRFNPLYNLQRFRWYIPSCAEQPEMTRTTRATLTGQQLGSASGNKIFLDVRIDGYRSLR